MNLLFQDVKSDFITCKNKSKNHFWSWPYCSSLGFPIFCANTVAYVVSGPSRIIQLSCFVMQMMLKVLSTLNTVIPNYFAGFIHYYAGNILRNIIEH